MLIMGTEGWRGFAMPPVTPLPASVKQLWRSYVHARNASIDDLNGLVASGQRYGRNLDWTPRQHVELPDLAR